MWYFVKDEGYSDLEITRSGSLHAIMELITGRAYEKQAMGLFSKKEMWYFC